jgi:hypothetical protein
MSSRAAILLSAALAGYAPLVPTAASAADQTAATIPVKAPSSATQSPDQFVWIAHSDTIYSSWRGSRGTNVFEPERGEGSQIYSPFTVGFDYQKSGLYRFQLRAKSGFVHSAHDTEGQQATLSTMVDTQVTATWTNLTSETYRAFFAVALNLPTGKTVLSGNQRLTRMDPDLVEIGSYGTGFNINPTAGFIFALTENTAVSIGAGYSWQGEFKREALNPDSVANCGLNCVPTPTFDVTQRIDPGDIFTANVNTSSFYNNLAVKTSFAFMSETDLKQDGVPIGRKGAKFLANVGVTYRVDPRWTLAANGSWSYTRKDEVPHDVILGRLVTEPKNSNSHLLIGSFDSLYAITDRLTAGLNYSLLWRNENYYDFTEDRFSPKKLKQSVGASFNYLVTPTSSIGLRGSYYWVDEDNGAFLVTRTFQNAIPPSPPPAMAFVPPRLSYTGWTVALSGKVQF